FRQQNYTNAEIQFRRIYQNTNWPVSELTYEAKMQEGRAAFARQGFNNAQELFTQILNAQPPYPGLVADAFFAYGDCLMMQASISTNAFARYEEASTAYRTITRNFPTNAVTPKAWGSLGNCLLQLAQQDPVFYTTEATNAYQQVLNHPLAIVQDRSQAEIGIALALKKRAESLPSLSDRTLLLEKALYHFHRVLYGNNLHAGEVAHPFWLKKAGLESAQTAETLQNWDAALGTYSRLRELLPQLAPDLDRRIARARAAKTGETRPAQ
ncbi:MAG: tetratricopeptide repeat protein, partial [Verrucomicrobia bacterium]|nr:tetratricopeptide repeat protein [Verrucomicrobiota bacterium]